MRGKRRAVVRNPLMAIVGVNKEDYSMRMSAYILIAMLVAVPARARLGDTSEQARQRYGRPTAESPVGQITNRFYTKEGFSITLGFSGDVAVVASYKGEKLTSDTVALILKQNGQGLTWDRVPDKPLAWMRSDKRALGVWSPGEQALAILDLADTYRQTKPLPPDEGSKPYTPTRVEWLIAQMNASHLFSNINADGFAIRYTQAIPLNPNAVSLLITYTHKANPTMMSNSIHVAESTLRSLADSKGWKWLEITKMVLDLDAEKAAIDESLTKDVERAIN